MQKFLLMIHGPMGAGKTTVAHMIFNSTPELFRAGFDKIKRNISNYEADKYTEALAYMTYALCDSALQNELSIMFEGGTRKEETGGHDYQQLARKHNARFIEVNIEAPFEILTQRFQERLDRVNEKGSKVSVSTMEGMTERYNRYIDGKKDIPTFDSSVLSAEEIYNNILALINK